MPEIKNIKQRWPTEGVEGAMMNSVHALDSRFYPHYADYWDAQIFRDVILGHIRNDSFILDLGAGSGFAKQMNFRGTVGKVCGLDPGPSVLRNPHLDEAKIGSGESIPWPGQTFDIVFAHNVLEHLSEPEAVFREVLRVLKPGGFFLAKTPNRFHYVTLVAQLTPTSFHKFFNQLRGRDDAHTFKTHYRVNSRNAIARLAKKCGFELRDLLHKQNQSCTLSGPLTAQCADIGAPSAALGTSFAPPPIKRDFFNSLVEDREVTANI